MRGVRVMLKKFISIIISLYFILSSNLVFANTIKKFEDDMYIYIENLSVYFIYGNYLDKCLNEPTIEKLDSIAYKKYSSMKYLKDKNIMCFNVEEKEYNSKVEYKVEESGSIFSIKNMEMLEPSNVNQILKKNNIYSEVKSISIILTDWGDETFPYIVWINTTDNNNYYLTSDLNYSFEESEGWMEEVYNVNWNEAKPLSQEKFNNMYLWREGQLYVNGEMVENRPMPIFERYICRVPIRTMLEEYGFKNIQWDRDNSAILAYSLKDNKTYAFLLPMNKNLYNKNVLIYGNDIVQKQINMGYDGLFFSNGRFYMSPHDYILFLGYTFNDNGYDYDIDYKNQSVSFFRVNK